MSVQEQEIIGSLAAGMVEDEITWLFNFSPCNRYSLCAVFVVSILEIVKLGVKPQISHFPEIGSVMA